MVLRDYHAILLSSFIAPLDNFFGRFIDLEKHTAPMPSADPVLLCDVTVSKVIRRDPVLRISIAVCVSVIDVQADLLLHPLIKISMTLSGGTRIQWRT